MYICSTIDVAVPGLATLADTLKARREKQPSLQLLPAQYLTVLGMVRVLLFVSLTAVSGERDADRTARTLIEAAYQAFTTNVLVYMYTTHLQ